jgi:hypothetical protein
VCYRCGKSSHFIAKCPYTSDNDRDDDKKGKKKKIEKTKYYKKKVSYPGFKEQSRVHLIHAPKKTTYIITDCIEINVTIIRVIIT